MTKKTTFKRRTFLKGMGGLGVLTLTGLSIGCKDKEPEEVPSEFPDVSQFPGQKPEAKIDLKTGEVSPDKSIIMRHSACLGCYSSCGNRVKIDKDSGKILRVYGNPYNPNNAGPHLPFDAPLTDAYLAFSQKGSMGHSNRGTLCGRGNATLETHYDPMRIITPLKRVAGRGDGKWKPITWDEAVNETVEGGKLFADIGEDREIEGFRQVRDLETLIDSAAPEFGSKSNQLVIFGGRGDGRGAFPGRFYGSFGTTNNYGHGYS